MTDLLVLAGVKKSFGDVPVLANVSGTFGTGTHLIEGDNGVGKTTLLNLMVGIVEPTAGSLRVCGWCMSKQNARARSMLAFSPAHPDFFEDISLEFAVRLFLSLRSCYPGKNVFSAFDPFGLRDYAKVRFSDLSLGWKKRALLHMAFVTRPAVLVLDEPTVGLDAAACTVLADLINDRREVGATVMTCHDPASLDIHKVKRYRLSRAAGRLGTYLSTCDVNADVI